MLKRSRNEAKWASVVMTSSDQNDIPVSALEKGNRHVYSTALQDSV